MTETKFDTDEFTFAYPDGIEKNYWNLARNKTILNTINKFPNIKLLDVGAGRGIVTDFLFHHNIQINGVELGKTTPISNSNVPIYYNTDALQISNEISEQYNAISLFDVIEHIEDPMKFINNLLLNFKNVEYLIITVPARKELWTNFDEYYKHFKRYDLEMLSHEMKALDFEVVENRYFFHSLYALIRVSNFLTKKREIKFNVPKGIAKIFHSVFGQLFYLEKFFIPKYIYGSSIICIAKKNKK